MKMMKQHIVIAICLTGFVFSCGQENNEAMNTGNAPEVDTTAVSKMDSLSIQDYFADSPFETEGDNYIYFENHFADTTATQIILQENEYEPGNIDTVKTIYWSTNYIETVQNEDMSSPLLSVVSITNNDLVLRNSIRIGQTAEEVFEEFDAAYNPEKEYAHLLLETPVEGGGASNFLYFIFEKNVLKEILYLPYTG